MVIGGLETLKLSLPLLLDSIRLTEWNGQFCHTFSKRNPVLREVTFPAYRMSRPQRPFDT